MNTVSNSSIVPAIPALVYRTGIRRPRAEALGPDSHTVKFWIEIHEALYPACVVNHCSESLALAVRQNPWITWAIGTQDKDRNEEAQKIFDCETRIRPKGQGIKDSVEALQTNGRALYEQCSTDDSYAADPGHSGTGMPSMHSNAQPLSACKNQLSLPAPPPAAAIRLSITHLMPPHPTNLVHPVAHIARQERTKASPCNKAKKAVTEAGASMARAFLSCCGVNEARGARKQITVGPPVYGFKIEDRHGEDMWQAEAGRMHECIHGLMRR